MGGALRPLRVNALFQGEDNETDQRPFSWGKGCCEGVKGGRNVNQRGWKIGKGLESLSALNFCFLLPAGICKFSWMKAGKDKNLNTDENYMKENI